MSEKWIKFEEDLAFIICDGLSKQVSADYWNELVKIFTSKSKNESFLRGLNRVENKQ
jgi:uncharacterized membrane protein